MAFGPFLIVGVMNGNSCHVITWQDKSRLAASLAQLSARPPKCWFSVSQQPVKSMYCSRWKDEKTPAYEPREEKPLSVCLALSTSMAPTPSTLLIIRLRARRIFEGIQIHPLWVTDGETAASREPGAEATPGGGLNTGPHPVPRRWKCKVPPAAPTAPPGVPGGGLYPDGSDLPFLSPLRLQNLGANLVVPAQLPRSSSVAALGAPGSPHLSPPTHTGAPSA